MKSTYPNEFSFHPDSLADKLIFKNTANKEYFKRIYTTPLSVYKDRLRLINLENKKMVLDAGCGLGQWTIGLAEINDEIHAIDADSNRILITKMVSELNKKTNIYLNSGTTEQLPFRNNTFDAIFSYSVIYSTDFRKTIKEFYRVLKPNGIIYFATNEIGYYLKCILTNYNSTPDHSSRMSAFRTIFSSIKFFFTKKRKNNTDIIIPTRILVSTLKSTGFKNIICKPEGHIHLNKNVNPRPFYPATYFGFKNIFEIMAEK